MCNGEKDRQESRAEGYEEATKKAAQKAVLRPPEHQSDGREGTTNADDSKSLPNTQVRVEDLEVLRSLIEAFVLKIVQQVFEGLQVQLHGSEQAAAGTAPAQPSPYEPGKIDRLLATTSDLRERLARIEVAITAIRSRVTLLEENQRPPEPAPDREAAARNAMGRWMLANQCRSSPHRRPTAAIIGRVMSDERAFDQRTAKSPQPLFFGILDAVRRVFRPATPEPDQEAEAVEQDYVHLTEEIVEVIEERSSIPKKKHAEFLNDQLKPRLELLKNSGLAEEITNRTGRRTNYSRYLTPMGREVFDGWPEWDDRTGGISLADELMQPDPNAAGRPVIEATSPPESQPASTPPPSPPPAT